VCLLHDRIDAEIINANPDLKLIASMAITPAGIDVAAASSRRIPVTNIPPFVTEATTDLHWALLLAVGSVPLAKPWHDGPEDSTCESFIPSAGA
jgi:glyoxylate reductase